MSLRSSVSKISRELDAIYEEQYEREANKIPEEDLDYFCLHGYWPDGKRYEMFSELLRHVRLSPEYEGKTGQELEFFVVNGRWPDLNRGNS